MNPVGAWKAKLERTYAFRFQSNRITVCLQTKFFDYFWKNLKNYIDIYVFNNYLNSHLKIKLDLPRWRLLTDSIKFFFSQFQSFQPFWANCYTRPTGQYPGTCARGSYNRFKTLLESHYNFVLIQGILAFYEFH